MQSDAKTFPPNFIKKNMTMPHRLSKLMLTSHITFSVGWLGAVVVFLVLAITGLKTQDMQMARAAYLAMELSALYAIVPFCLASLLTGIIQSIGTKWGLVKHYWVIAKLFLTVAATALLLLHMKPISYMAGLASNTTFANTTEPGLRVQLIADAGAAILVLLLITALSVYKPWGRTQYGLSNESILSLSTQERVVRNKKIWKTIVLVAIGILLIVFIIRHLKGGGMGNH